MSAPVTHRGVVVAADGSAASKAAVRWGARTAAMRHAPLTVVSTVNLAVPSWPEAPLPVTFGQWQTDEAQRIVDDTIGIARQCAPPATVAGEVIFGPAVPTLVELSGEAEMMVVGRHGRGALAGLLGSVSTSLVRRAHCPVAVIHDEDPLARSAQAPVLVGIDGSPASEAATAIAFAEASWRGVGLTALHAWSDVSVLELPGLQSSAMKEAAERSLAERLAGWQERYPDVTVQRLVVCDSPARQLIEMSELAQLVVVGSHGRGGFTGMLLGSVSNAVLQAVRVPVIVARPQ